VTTAPVLAPRSTTETLYLTVQFVHAWSRGLQLGAVRGDDLVGEMAIEQGSSCHVPGSAFILSGRWEVTLRGDGSRGAPRG
jgi:hypothetical protein